MTKQLTLAGGRVTLVDAADYDWIAQERWSFDGKYVTRQAREGGRHHKVYLHRVIAGAAGDELVDHINGNRLDNRRANLRICTKQQNCFNSQGKGGSSAYKGVSWDSANRRWSADITINGRSRRLGRFTSELDAARAYNRAARELHGEYARLNEVPE